MVKKSNIGVSTLYAVLGIIVILIVGFIAGYYMKPVPESGGYQEDSAWRTESIDISGSTTVLPIANACAIELMNRYTGIVITVSSGGSGRGYSDVISETVDIGDASRPPKKTELDTASDGGVDLWLHPIALDAVCVAVHPSVSDNMNLTMTQVGKIFNGTYRSWNEVDSTLADETITVFVREDGSGTRGTFDEYMEDTLGEGHYSIKTDLTTEKTSNQEVKAAVETTQYSIAYLGFGFISDDMTVVALLSEDESQYIYPTLDSIGEGKYPISRYLYFVTSSQPETGSLVDRFIDFVLSSDGQQIVQNKGFLKLPTTYNYP